MDLDFRCQPDALPPATCRLMACFEESLAGLVVDAGCQQDALALQQALQTNLPAGANILDASYEQDAEDFSFIGPGAMDDLRWLAFLQSPRNVSMFESSNLKRQLHFAAPVTPVLPIILRLIKHVIRVKAVVSRSMSGSQNELINRASKLKPLCPGLRDPRIELAGRISEPGPFESRWGPGVCVDISQPGAEALADTALQVMKRAGSQRLDLSAPFDGGSELDELRSASFPILVCRHRSFVGAQCCELPTTRNLRLTKCCAPLPRCAVMVMMMLMAMTMNYDRAVDGAVGEDGGGDHDGDDDNAEEKRRQS
ncbi:hypothetical protein AK812_SmicGene18517 [Symbiodinium microadriaticum]|uniref:Uncharacterized protein n=1 Tax=Symbiodinium microadriaticum TaxID=2951 RepID=A0A1Q9DUW9_SYMMI|nr:hypothetical protein AK812_SmicGene18517 [Symbiodinium microadriaticum]